MTRQQRRSAERAATKEATRPGPNPDAQRVAAGYANRHQRRAMAKRPEPVRVQYDPLVVDQSTDVVPPATEDPPHSARVYVGVAVAIAIIATLCALVVR